MSVQASLDISNKPFVLGGEAYSRNGTIITDGGRTAILKKYTVLAKITASNKYTPFVSLTTTTGASVPSAIYMGEDIAAADLVSGDVVDLPILVGGCARVDIEQVVFDANTLSEDSIITSAAANPYLDITARDCLAMFGIFLEDTVEISNHEN
jgi:hypothetical protein